MSAPIGPLFLLWLMSQAGTGSRRRGRRQDDPHAFPPDGPVRPTPAGYRGTGEWTPYAPLTPEVIARADAILRDPTAHELIEPDPTHPGETVRYLRTHDTHTGKTNVTAWRHRAALPTSPGLRTT